MGKDSEKRLDHHVAAGNGSSSSSEEDAGAETAVPPGPAVRVEPEGGARLVATKVLHFVAAIFLFVLAIQLMKEGAGWIGFRLAGSGLFDNAYQTLGLGWLGAYLVLSGSPIAATALAFHSTHAINELQTFAMLSGSRLGASFIVLLVGFLYAIRSRNRRESLGMGVLALSMTAIVYVPGMLLGYWILESGLLSGVDWTAGQGLNSIIDLGWGWAMGFALETLPLPLLFPIGLGVILISFKLLDRVLPALDGEKHADSKGHWLKKPWPMFFLGSLAALLTLSVSVALTVLVPLASRGYVNRQEAIPYIAGANIMTLADTLVAAMLLGTATGVQVVLAQFIAVAVITVLLLAFAYRWLQRGIMALDEWVVGTTVRLWLFVGILFVVPMALIVLGRLVGPPPAA